MHQIYLLCTLSALLLFTSCARKTAFNKFHRSHKQYAEVAIGAPGWMANLFIPKKDLEPEERALLRKAKFHKIMIYDNDDMAVAKEFDHFVEEHGLIPLIEVSDADVSASIYLKEKDDLIREVIIQTGEADQMIIYGAKVKLTKDDLKRIMRQGS